MTVFHMGDRVHMTVKFASALSKRRKISIDWANRVGTVMSANQKRVRVLFDGRKTCESYDPRVLEMVTS